MLKDSDTSKLCEAMLTDPRTSVCIHDCIMRSWVV